MFKIADSIIQLVAFDSDGAVVGWAYGEHEGAELEIFTFSRQGTDVISIPAIISARRRNSFSAKKQR